MDKPIPPSINIPIAGERVTLNTNELYSDCISLLYGIIPLEIEYGLIIKYVIKPDRNVLREVDAEIMYPTAMKPMLNENANTIPLGRNGVKSK